MAEHPEVEPLEEEPAVVTKRPKVEPLDEMPAVAPVAKPPRRKPAPGEPATGFAALGLSDKAQATLLRAAR